MTGFVQIGSVSPKCHLWTVVKYLMLQMYGIPPSVQGVCFVTEPADMVLCWRKGQLDPKGIGSYWPFADFCP